MSCGVWVGTFEFIFDTENSRNFSRAARCSNYLLFGKPMNILQYADSIKETTAFKIQAKTTIYIAEEKTSILKHQFQLLLSYQLQQTY